jgi:hypothetical protein
MRATTRPWCWTILLLWPIATLAAAPYVDIEQRLTAEQRQATGIDSLSAAQLALLNRLLSEDTAKIVESARTEAKAEAQSARAAGPGRLAGLDDGPIESRVEGRVVGWQPGSVFKLANGQHWKVLKGEVTLRTPLDAPEIIVVPGVAGRWFLQVSEDMPKARVYRID